MYFKLICTLIVMVLIMLAPGPGFAVQPDEVLKDPVLESRARDLSERLRCMVCQNQSIDDSDAPLARDLRLLVRERLTKGDSDGQVIDYLVDRYGEFVLLQPKFAAHTLILWLSAPLVLLLGGFALWLTRKRRSVVAAPAAPLSGDEQQAINKILSDDD